jgi:hypothetical protein
MVVEERVSVYFFVTRDSVDGVLAEHCELWCVKPLRSKQPTRVTWLPRAVSIGHMGRRTLAEVKKQFGTVPETDLELIRIEQWFVEPVTATVEPPKKPMKTFKKKIK